MNVLNINSYYYSSTVHRQLKTALLKEDINVDTYVPVFKGYSPRAECDYKDDEKVIKSECFNEKDRYIFHLKHLKIEKDIRNKLYLERYSILHAHSLFSNGYIAMKLHKRYEIPYIVAVRDTDINVFFKKMKHLRNLGNRILKSAEAVVFLSESYKSIVLDEYVKTDRESIAKKCVVIPNGIDNFWLANKNQELLNISYNLDTINLLHVGAISKRKNLETTIKAIDILNQKGHQVQYSIVGKVEDQSIYNTIKNKEYTNFLNQQAKEELLKTYRANDILVVPSLSETFGLVYPEALTQAVPIIYSKGQGFDGQIKDDFAGYAVDSTDAYEIADNIIAIKSDYNQFQKNCLMVSDKFDWKKIVKQYTKLYEQIEE